MWAAKRSTETEDQDTVSVQKMRGVGYIYDVLILCQNMCGMYTYGSRICNGSAGWRVLAFVFLVNCVFTTCIGWLHTVRLFYIAVLDDIFKSQGALKLTLAVYNLYLSSMQTCMVCLSKRLTKLGKEIRNKGDGLSPRWIVIFHVSLILTILTSIITSSIFAFIISNDDAGSNTSLAYLYTQPFDHNSLEGRICLGHFFYSGAFALFREVIWLLLTGVLCYHIRYKFIDIKCKLEDISSTSVIRCDVIEELRHTYEQAIDYMREVDTVLSWRALLMLATVLFTDCFSIYDIKIWSAGKEEFIFFIMFLCFSNAFLLAVIVLSAQVHSAAKSVGHALPKIQPSNNDVETGISVQLFLTQVLGSDVGISVAGFFVIQKSTFLTIVETLMTYAAVVLQLPSPEA
ncbi:gustatory receptor for bitter taste 93a-like [Haliotis asinina]|uniref:gustatory receptor for bitter taste 93a-like n=1 Tax=Haliotis asinina TaxID=109174 RepID=UPI0035322243